jgi:hypothetical protein
MTKAQFLARNSQGPGYGWYLGTPTELPSIESEGSEEFIELRMSTSHYPVWPDFDYLKGLVAKSGAQKRKSISWLENEARSRSGLVISSDPGIPWGSLTPEFAWSVYYRGFQELLGMVNGPRTYAGNFPRNQLQEYIAVESSRLETPPKLGWQGPPPNIPFCFMIEEGQLAVICNWPKTTYPSRIIKLHGRLIDEWPEVPRAEEILATDNEQKEVVTKVREGLSALL